MAQDNNISVFETLESKSKSVKMSDHIPFELQSEVMKRVHPVKSLIRLRSVCKEWKSLIDSSEFITHHLLVNTQPHHLLIRYKEDASDMNYVSVVVDDNDIDNDIDNTFPQHKSYPTLPPNATSILMRDSSHGLVFFLGEIPSKLIVVWNPSIRKSVSILSPIGTNIAAFGVCPNTGDVKIVAIKTDSTAEVFTLSTRLWRRIPMNLFSMSTTFWYNQVVVDGVIHWVAYDPNEEEFRKRIIKFDLASEEFGEVAFLDGILDFGYAGILRFKESLAVVDYREDDAGKLVCDVWVMLKNGATKSSFAKLFTINHNFVFNTVIGYRKNGQPIGTPRNAFLEGELEVYEPGSEHVNGLGIHGSLFNMVNYAESLLLLNHPDSIIE